MGLEAPGVRLVDGRKIPGRALLETDEFVFRGDARVRVNLAEILRVAASGNRLDLATATTSYSFELEADVENWAQRLRSPKTRIEKLGVKQGSQVALLCMADESFRSEVEQAQAALTTHDRNLDTLFVGAGAREELRGFRDWARRIKPQGAVWVVYPKARKEITEEDVLTAGRKAGLKDVKVVRFSETHTAPRFVIPATER